MILRNCSPARPNDPRLYGGPGGASSAEANTAPSRHPSCHLRCGHPATPCKWRLGRTLGGNAGERWKVEQPWAWGRIDGRPWVLWRRTAGAERFSRSSAVCLRLPARSGPKEHGLRKYLSSLTSVRGANIQVPDRFSGAGWSRTYFARRGIIAGEARFGLGRARMETFCAALHGNGLT